MKKGTARSRIPYQYLRLRLKVWQLRVFDLSCECNTRSENETKRRKLLLRRLQPIIQLAACSVSIAPFDDINSLAKRAIACSMGSDCAPGDAGTLCRGDNDDLGSDKCKARSSTGPSTAAMTKSSGSKPPDSPSLCVAIAPAQQSSRAGTAGYANARVEEQRLRTRRCWNGPQGR